MKTLLTTVAVAATLMATTVSADTDLGAGFSLGTDVKAERKFDAETSIVTVNPEITYGAIANTEITFGTTLSIWDNTDSFTLDDEFNHLPVLEFGATYDIQDNLSLEAATTYDLEAKERGEATVSLILSF